MSKRRWRMRRDLEGKLHRVRRFNGIEVYIVHFTVECSGCTEHGDYGTTYGPYGCRECGYTGRRRSSHPVPFNPSQESTMWGRAMAKESPRAR